MFKNKDKIREAEKPLSMPLTDTLNGYKMVDSSLRSAFNTLSAAFSAVKSKVSGLGTLATKDKITSGDIDTSGATVGQVLSAGQSGAVWTGIPASGAPVLDTNGMTVSWTDKNSQNIYCGVINNTDPMDSYSV